MNTIKINNHNVLVKQYNGQRVVTFKDIDAVHKRAGGTARRNFNNNKTHFIEGEDFFKISPNEFRTAIAPMDKRQSNDVTVVTESGYLMLVKSFTDDLSWEVQRQLVKSYFRSKKEKPVEEQLELYEYFDKTYKGEPVLSTIDVSHFSGINYAVIDWYARNFLKKGEDYYYLVSEELKEYKSENPKVSKYSSVVIVFTKIGFEKICKYYDIKLETPKLFIEDKKEPEQMKFVTPQIKEKMSCLRDSAERLIHLTYLLDNEPGTILSGETYHQFKMAIIRQAKQVSSFNL